MQRKNTVNKREKILFQVSFIGRVSMFTSGSENLHEVERVQSGTRYALTVSFTCDPNAAISDPNYRIKWEK